MLRTCIPGTAVDFIEYATLVFHSKYFKERGSRQCICEKLRLSSCCTYMHVGD